MRSCIFVLALTLTGLSEPQAGAAQGAGAGAARIGEMTSRGFPYVLAQLQPQGMCAGQLVVATWYASGRRTASGQAFNSDRLTAAHRNLPFGSQVAVTNPRNGKSVTVVINDRGPFTRGITLDLARDAAQAIGMTNKQQVCISQVSR